MGKVAELLKRIENEVLDKTNAIVLSKDEEIKTYAQEAYDNAVETKITEIKKDVERGYETAKAYLLELLAEEKAAAGEPILSESETEAEVVKPMVAE